jgi:hypothetical protein
MNFKPTTVRVLFAIVAALILPAMASAQKSGYVWANEPASASYTPNPAYSFNSSGGAITISRNGVGVYAVRFSGLGGGPASGGNVLVTSYGNGSETCKVANWGSSGVDFTANVRCFTAAGTAADTTYAMRVIWNNPAFIKNGYAWADNPTSAGYTPNAMYSFNSSGGAIGITRSGVGTYAVNFSGLGGNGPGGNVQVTAYGSDAATCKAASWGFSADFTVNVRCFKSGGSPVDTQYSINIVR